MHGLNNSVIMGKCPSCLIYEERVARLEAANAAKDTALREYLRATGGDFCCVCYKPHSNFKRPDNHEPWCQRAKARAALSDTGEGWLEVREQALAGIVAVAQMWDDFDDIDGREFNRKYPWLDTLDDNWSERLMYAFTRAALDKLKGG